MRAASTRTTRSPCCDGASGGLKGTASVTTPENAKRSLPGGGLSLVSVSLGFTTATPPVQGSQASPRPSRLTRIRDRRAVVVRSQTRSPSGSGPLHGIVVVVVVVVVVGAADVVVVLLVLVVVVVEVVVVVVTGSFVSMNVSSTLLFRSIACTVNVVSAVMCTERYW
jgi:hypothetical protein